MALGFPKNEPRAVPGTGLSKGGTVGGQQHMHMRADEMADHDTEVGKATPMGAWPSSPAHSESINLENAERCADEMTPSNANMSPGLGPIQVPGKGL